MIEEFDYDEKEWDLIVEEFMKELDEHRIYDNIHRIYAKKETESKEEVYKRKFNFSLLQTLLSCFKKSKKFKK
jgi:hypothetical protein